MFLYKIKKKGDILNHNNNRGLTAAKIPLIPSSSFKSEIKLSFSIALIIIKYFL